MPLSWTIKPTINGFSASNRVRSRSTSIVTCPEMLAGSSASLIAWKEFITASKRGRSGFHRGRIVCRTWFARSILIVIGNVPVKARQRGMIVKHFENGKRRVAKCRAPTEFRSEEHTFELQSQMRMSYADSCLKKKKTYTQ